MHTQLISVASGFRNFLAVMSKTLSTPFSDWGNIVYIKRHKEFYEKHYTNEYIKWKKAEEKIT